VKTWKDVIKKKQHFKIKVSSLLQFMHQ